MKAVASQTSLRILILNRWPFLTFTLDKTDHDGGYSAKCIVAVVDNSQKKVTGVSLDKTSVSMNIGETVYLYETVSPFDASDKSVTWSSSNSSVASVNSSGRITARSVGNAVIITRRLTESSGPAISEREFMKELGITEEELDAAEEPEIE